MVGSRSASLEELLVSCGGCGALHPPDDGLAMHPLCERCRPGDGPPQGGMGRFRALDERTITDAITETSPGNYVLGYLDGTAFTVFYVGRSDSDVCASLQSWVDAPSRPRRERSSSLEPWRVRTVPLPGFGMRAPSRAAFGVDTGYTHFAFCYAQSAIAAFEQECRDYHELGGREGLDNERHPLPPQDSPWACPLHG